MKIGIIGLPNVGKSSLFNLLTKAHAQVANYPFTTIDRNVGMASIPDIRLKKIVEINQAEKVKLAQIEFIDIAGLIKGASQGDGLGNQFLAHIRDVNLILHLLRSFEEVDIPHTNSVIMPEEDYEIVRAELFLADLSITERRIKKIEKRAECRDEMMNLKRIKQALASGKVPKVALSNFPLLTTKPELVVLNLDENGKFISDIEGYRLSIKLEEEIQEFTEAEKREFRRGSSLAEDGLSGLVQQGLKHLKMISFYTIKGEETRAWIIAQGSNILDAAGMIHSDMKEGFIKAEILAYDDFIAEKGFARAQQHGKTKIEGKEYEVQDGDIILIKFRA